jgi:hypothetical protein
MPMMSFGVLLPYRGGQIKQLKIMKGATDYDCKDVFARERHSSSMV